MPTTDSNETNITNPTRVKNFANFFKNYMSIWSVVVASLPIPVTAFNLIPTFNYQKNFLSTYTTLFCFLILGYIFYSRHKMAKLFFPQYYTEIKRAQLPVLKEEIRPYTEEEILKRKWETEWTVKKSNRYIRSLQIRATLLDSIPLLFIFLSLTSAFLYNDWLEGYITTFDITKLKRENILDLGSIPSAYSTRLIIYYLGIFLFAEAAFILMAIKEYIQDLLKINDTSLMINRFADFETAKPSNDPISIQPVR